jgi:hypothetical protein
MTVSLVVLCAVLIGTYLAERARLKAQRRALFDDCLTRFDAAEIRQDGVAYPALAGRYRAFDVHVEAIVDHLSFRKLPQLLVRVTLRAPVPWNVVVDVLARPQNTEFYTPWSRLVHDVNRRPGWPAHAAARADTADPLPFADVLDRWMPWFDDANMKELLVTRRGVRLVYRLREAERGPYLLLRQAVFAHPRLDAALAERLLGALVALHQDLCGAASPQRTVS